MSRHKNKGHLRVLIFPDTSRTRKCRPFLSQPFPNLSLKALQLIRRSGTQLQLLRESPSQNPDELIDAPFLFYVQEERRSGLGVHTILGLSLVAEPPPPYESRQAEAKDEGVETKNPDIVLALDELNGDGNSHRHLLATVGVTILFVVLTNGFVGEPELRNLSKKDVAGE